MSAVQGISEVEQSRVLRRPSALKVKFSAFRKTFDLFEQNKNQSGVGITTKGNTGWGIKLQDIFEGKNPTTHIGSYKRELFVMVTSLKNVVTAVIPM